MNEIAPYLESFKQIRKTTEHGAECWTARDLQRVLGYDSWENFKRAVERAREACVSSGAIVSHHFHDITKKVELGSGAIREVEDILLSRYACYLTAMNGDPGKTAVAAAQTYFAVQTRKQEVEEAQTDDEKRIRLRDRVRDANKNLSSAAKDAGVQRYGIFQDAGYKGLYGGMGVSAVKAKKGGPRTRAARALPRPRGDRSLHLDAPARLSGASAHLIRDDTSTGMESGDRLPTRQDIHGPANWRCDRNLERTRR